MTYVLHDKKYHFVSAFDPQTGAYVRSGILKDGKDTGKDPFMASFPHLIDVGVMGHCLHGKTGLCVKAGIGCYQSGLTVEQPNMSVEDFRWIARQCRHKVNQFALGGRGDPDQHEQFEELLQICRENDIVPNFTTSGYGMTQDLANICKQYCGAVAVSWYRSPYTLRAIEMLLKAGVKTNVHYVLGNNSIDEALERLEKKTFPDGINAVVFLLHKPIGLGSRENVLSSEDPRVARFFRNLDRSNTPYKVGVDSCTVPGIINYCSRVTQQSLDTCEGGRFSCYISADLMMMPCSFDQTGRFSVSLRNKSIREVWTSDTFEAFRASLRNSCPHCSQRDTCMGGCPLIPEVVLCQKAEKQQYTRKKEPCV